MPISPSNFFGSIFVALQCDVLSRVASTNDQNVLIFELIKLSELMAMSNFPLKQLNPFQLRKIRI